MPFIGEVSDLFSLEIPKAKRGKLTSHGARDFSALKTNESRTVVTVGVLEELSVAL
jgi:hypothetical protein